MERKGRLGLAILALGLALSPITGQAANHIVNIDDFFFSPAKTHVQVNDSVIWVWGGSFTHTSTSDLGSGKTWNSGNKISGRFGIKIVAGDGPGPFPYHCNIHPSMIDTIFLDAPVPCCPSTTGNIDCDPTQNVDISDLTTLIDHLFISFATLCCDKAANTDGQPGVDISDLTTLIDHLFINFSPLAPCQ